MPFGLVNAPAIFERALDTILARFKCNTRLVYLDDVIIFSKSYEEHFDHLSEVLSALEKSGVTLKLKTCRFFTKEVKYLGHIIKPGGLEVCLFQGLETSKATRDTVRSKILSRHMKCLPSIRASLQPCCRPP